MQNINSNTLVSIAIPAYKSGFLYESINSVLTQTYRNIELIIVNDDSPEDIESIVRMFSDSRIRYYKNEVNLGSLDPVANWNKCLSLAKGRYFSLLCDDDLYESSFIEDMLKLKERYPDVHVFRSRVKIVDSHGDILDMYPSSPEYETCFDYMWHKLNWLRRQTISEFFYDTEYIRNMGGYYPLPKAWGSDDISCFKFSKSNGIVTSNKLLVSFRMSGQNISANNDKFIRDKVRATVLYKDEIKKIVQNDSDENICKMILLANESNYERQMAWSLYLSNFKDFMWVVRNIHLNKKIILKSILKKLS